MWEYFVGNILVSSPEEGFGFAWIRHHPRIGMGFRVVLVLTLLSGRAPGAATGSGMGTTTALAQSSPVEDPHHNVLITVQCANNLSELHSHLLWRPGISCWTPTLALLAVHT